MKEILIFEDGENTPSSRLLKASFNGDNIYFAERCTNMKDTLDKLYNNTDRFWLFYDVPPNNEIAVNSYMSLCQELYSYKRVCDTYNLYRILYYTYVCGVQLRKFTK